MLARKIIAASSAFAVISALVASACSSATCTELHRDCDGAGGLAGVSGSTGGASVGGAAGTSVGGAAGSGDAGDNSGAGDAGAAGAAACDGGCKGPTPVCDGASNKCVQCVDGKDCKTPTKPACDAATNTCVECVKSGDCKTSAKPACDTDSNTCVGCVENADCKDAAKPVCDAGAAKCVACLRQADCGSATASACSDGVCTACTKDEQCSDIAGKGVCDAGTCVQCTVAKEAVCSGKSCNPANSQCTNVATGSVSVCAPCASDSECIGGNKADPDRRCVPMKFKGAPRPGGFCLQRVVKSCAQPYEIPLDVPSLSGAPSEQYCGIDQSATRCEAVLDLVAGLACSDGLDSSCGCVRGKDGKCLEAGQGGLCRTVGVNANRCTYSCGTATDCPGGKSCMDPLPYCH